MRAASEGGFQLFVVNKDRMLSAKTLLFFTLEGKKEEKEQETIFLLRVHSVCARLASL